MVYHKSLKPEAFGKLYKMMAQSNRLSDGFLWDINQDGFIEWAYTDEGQRYLLFYEDEISGLFYINDIGNKKCRGHFILLPNITGKNIYRLLEFCASNILYLKENDSYYYDVILGVTPVRNKANKIFKRLGRPIGIIPNVLYDHRLKKTIDGHLTAFTRQEIKEVKL
jgi:hypothetical protein